MSVYVATPPYRQRALETRRTACSVYLMYMLLAVCERQSPWRTRSLSGLTAATAEDTSPDLRRCGPYWLGSSPMALSCFLNSSVALSRSTVADERTFTFGTLNIFSVFCTRKKFTQAPLQGFLGLSGSPFSLSLSLSFTFCKNRGSQQRYFPVQFVNTFYGVHTTD